MATTYDGPTRTCSKCGFSGAAVKFCRFDLCGACDAESRKAATLRIKRALASGVCPTCGGAYSNRYGALKRHYRACKA